MQERRSVLVEFHPCLDRACEVRLAGLAHQSIQHPLRGARSDDGDPDAAPGGAHEGIGHRIVGNEVGVGQVDR